MAKIKNPMSLEDLPEYLKNAREKGETGAPIVNTGQIVTTTNNSPSWFQGTLIALLLIVTLGLGSMITYNAMSKQNIIINIDIANGDVEKISKIITDAGGEVLSIDQKSNDSFEVEIKTNKSKKFFLDWLRGKENVRKVEW